MQVQWKEDGGKREITTKELWGRGKNRGVWQQEAEQDFFIYIFVRAESVISGHRFLLLSTRVRYKSR